MSTAANQGRCVTSCLPTLWAEAHPTIIRIMQLGRSYSRRLKSVKYDINELYPSARHAYNTIGPAVKTSRPRFQWTISNEQLSIFNCIIWAFPLCSLWLKRGRAFSYIFLLKIKRMPHQSLTRAAKIHEKPYLYHRNNYSKNIPNAHNLCHK